MKKTNKKNNKKTYRALHAHYLISILNVNECLKEEGKKQM
jgi:hypothetical protein